MRQEVSFYLNTPGKDPVYLMSANNLNVIPRIGESVSIQDLPQLLSVFYIVHRYTSSICETQIHLRRQDAR